QLTHPECKLGWLQARRCRSFRSAAEPERPPRRLGGDTASCFFTVSRRRAPLDGRSAENRGRAVRAEPAFQHGNRHGYLRRLGVTERRVLFVCRVARLGGESSFLDLSGAPRGSRLAPRALSPD